MRYPFWYISKKFSLFLSTEGHTDTMTLIPSECNSSIIFFGSGQYSGSNFQSPWYVQWKKSMTIQSIGIPSLTYLCATSNTSSCVLYLNLHCHKPSILSRYSGALPVTLVYVSRILFGVSSQMIQ